jgi:RNA polymerase sigma-70 factor, ECF subfamily
MKLLEPSLECTIEANELARRAQSGSRSALETLVTRFRPRLVLLLSRRLQHSALDPEDIVQESLIKACQQLHRFDGKYQFSTWIFTIAFRTATDAIRQSRRRPVHADIDVHTLPSNTYPLTGETSEPQADESEGTNRIWFVARTSLNAAQYEALWLRYGEELPVGEISRVLGRTRVGVRVLLHRARRILQPALSQAMEAVESQDRMEGMDARPTRARGK